MSPQLNTTANPIELSVRKSELLTADFVKFRKEASQPIITI
jgi:hypothetical protein